MAIIDTEQAFNRIAVSYDMGGGLWIALYRICPVCEKFLRAGKLLVNHEGVAKTEGWICKKHGEVHPHFEYL